MPGGKWRWQGQNVQKTALLLGTPVLSSKYYDIDYSDLRRGAVVADERWAAKPTCEKIFKTSCCEKFILRPRPHPDQYRCQPVFLQP